ncbi:MAG: hypothetical protein Q8O10_06055 [candidate division Zixibacteria bacterium]|nr:hypothetical protein [candidate division Zixibacteria bacterium]
MMKALKGFGILLMFSIILFLFLPPRINSQNQGLDYQVARPILKSFDISRVSIPLDSLFNVKINSDSTTQIQNEEQVVINPLNKDNVVAVWRDFRYGYRRVGVGRSSDGGRTWTDVLFNNAYGSFPWHSDPGLTVDRNGNFYTVVLGVDPGINQSEILVFKSTDGGISWGIPTTAVPPSIGIFEDKELMACDRSGGPYDGNLYIAWSRFYSNYNQIWFVRSTDGGNSFEDPQRIGDLNSVQWPVPAVGPDGEVYVAWVGFSSSALKLDKSIDGGVTFGTDRTIQPLSFVAGTINGGIYTFSYPAIDVDISNGSNRGFVYVAYEDYGTDGSLDMFFTRSTDGGVSWSTKKRINDDPSGNRADQFHPWLAVDQKGVISVIFYDRRNDPYSYLMDVYLTHSFDGGLTFTPNRRITTVSSDPRAGVSLAEYRTVSLKMPAGLIGEYIGLATWDSYLNAVWTDTREGNQNVYTTALRYYQPPSAFSLLMPPHQDSIFTESLTFSWEQALDTLPDRIVSYTLYLSKSVNFRSESTTVYTGLSQTSFHRDTLKTGPIYYWKVKASDNFGMERWSNQSRSFYRYLPGDANGDDRYSVSDAVFLVNYLFKGGKASSPLGAGDADCSRDVAVADIVYLVNYLFKGGPKPCIP